MKKNIVSITLFISVLLLVQTNAFADFKFENKIQHRQDKQSQRIEKGFNRGQLSYQELKRLFQKQYKFERLSQEFMEDGYYSHRERKILKRKYDKLDGMIYRMKHNQDKFRNLNRHKKSNRKS